MTSHTHSTGLEDLNTDTLLHMYKFSDAKDLSSLFQTCSKLRRKLADPLFRRDTVVTLRNVSKETAHSLEERNITALRLDNPVSITDLCTSLLSIAAMEIIEFMEINLRDKIFLESECISEITDTSSLTCLVISVHGNTATQNQSTIGRFIKALLLKGGNITAITELVMHYDQDEHYDMEKLLPPHYLTYQNSSP